MLSFQAQSFILYLFAFYSVTKDFIDKVVCKLTSIDIYSPEYYQLIKEYKASDCFDSFDDNDLTKRVSINIYEGYKSSKKQCGVQILINETLKCSLVSTLLLY